MTGKYYHIIPGKRQNSLEFLGYTQLDGTIGPTYVGIDKIVSSKGKTKAPLGWLKCLKPGCLRQWETELRQFTSNEPPQCCWYCSQAIRSSGPRVGLHHKKKIVPAHTDGYSLIYKQSLGVDLSVSEKAQVAEYHKAKKQARFATSHDWAVRIHGNLIERTAFRRNHSEARKHTDMNLKDVERILELGVSELTGIAFSLDKGENSKPNPYAPSVDHINNKGGSDRANIQIVTWQENEAKKDRPQTMFDQMCVGRALILQNQNPGETLDTLFQRLSENATASL